MLCPLGGAGVIFMNTLDDSGGKRDLSCQARTNIQGHRMSFSALGLLFPVFHLEGSLPSGTQSPWDAKHRLHLLQFYPEEESTQTNTYTKPLQKF